jgi:hypothetical protein
VAEETVEPVIRAADHVTTIEPDQPYWQDEMDEMLDDYD